MSERIEAWAVRYERLLQSGEWKPIVYVHYDFNTAVNSVTCLVEALPKNYRNISEPVHLIPATELEDLRAAVRWLYETWGDHYVPHRDTLRELYDDGDTMATAILKCWGEE